MSQKKGATNECTGASFSHPTVEHPFYHLRLTLRVDDRYQLTRLAVNGQRVRDFLTYHGFSFVKDRWLLPGGFCELVIRWSWTAGEEVTAQLAGESEKDRKPFELEVRATAPSSGGYWDPAWKHYASIVCTENAGLERRNEPVHASLTLYSERVQDPERELRLIAVDPVSGAHREVPRQVYEIERHDLKEIEHLRANDEHFDVRYRASTTLQLAFLAEVPACSSRVYLAFYGNPAASALSFPSDLRVEGNGLGLSVDNEFYRTLLAPTSGAIDEIHMKMGVNKVFAHHLETNGALHWNPGIYSPPRMWMHASDWNPPAHYEAAVGPVFVSTRRNGPLPDYGEESDVSITYRFYDRVPWIHMSSKIEVKNDIAVQALRNGEVVLNRELVDEFAWRRAGGGADTMVITDGPRHPEHAKVLPPDTPWACFFSRQNRCGLGLITSKLASFRLDGGLVKLFKHYSYLQWGPWVYYARPLVYTFATNNPAQFVKVRAGNIYYEEMAFVPIRVDPRKEDFRQLEELYQRLAHPLDVQTVEDTDLRAPEGWLDPVLVQEFDHMTD